MDNFRCIMLSFTREMIICDPAMVTEKHSPGIENHSKDSGNTIIPTTSTDDRLEQRNILVFSVGPQFHLVLVWAVHNYLVLM